MSAGIGPRDKSPSRRAGGLASGVPWDETTPRFFALDDRDSERAIPSKTPQPIQIRESGYPSDNSERDSNYRDFINK
ncbi:hypothetical protein JCM33374_g2268 [Metschnikowia sp. JCM 33374]|nr:hypothetical protein JCM33374_g2268 [Metschnikowia sp. JCM 33374]